jgi:hypothetical protein
LLRAQGPAPWVLVDLNDVDGLDTIVNLQLLPSDDLRWLRFTNQQWHQGAASPPFLSATLTRSPIAVCYCRWVVAARPGCSDEVPFARPLVRKPVHRAPFDLPQPAPTVACHQQSLQQGLQSLDGRYDAAIALFSLRIWGGGVERKTEGTAAVHNGGGGDCGQCPHLFLCNCLHSGQCPRLAIAADVNFPMAEYGTE